jgi:hypothetical protein
MANLLLSSAAGSADLNLPGGRREAAVRYSGTEGNHQSH